VNSSRVMSTHVMPIIGPVCSGGGTPCTTKRCRPTFCLVLLLKNHKCFISSFKLDLELNPPICSRDMSATDVAAAKAAVESRVFDENEPVKINATFNLVKLLSL